MRKSARGNLKHLIIAFFMTVFAPLVAESAPAAVPSSAINISVVTSAADLATIINRFLPQELYKGGGDGNIGHGPPPGGARGSQRQFHFFPAAHPADEPIRRIRELSHPDGAGVQGHRVCHKGLAAEDRPVLHGLVGQLGRLFQTRTDISETQEHGGGYRSTGAENARPLHRRKGE